MSLGTFSLLARFISILPVLALLLVWLADRNVKAVVGEFPCGYEYSTKAGVWFKVHRQRETWEDAHSTCLMEAAMLASPINEGIKKVMLTLIKTDPHIYNGRSKTVIHIGRQGDFIKALIATGQQTIINKNTTLPFICYRMEPRFLKVDECGILDPEYKMDHRTRKCYKIHRLPSNWFDADITCKAEGGYLAIINSKTEAKVIQDVFARYPQDTTPGATIINDAFIGFRADNNGTWRTLPAIIKRSPPPCYHYYHTDGFWQRIHTRGPYWRYAFDNCIRTVRTPKQFPCGYNYFFESKYWFKVHTQEKNWYDAFDTCASEGAQLATPENEDIKKAMLALMVTLIKINKEWSSIRSIHINLYYEVKVRHMAHKEPFSMTLSETGDLSEFNRNISLPFICYQKGPQILQINECGTADPDYQFNNRTKRCYKFHRVSTDWWTAVDICEMEGAYLAVINGIKEARVIRDIFAENPAEVIRGYYKDAAFLGFYADAHSLDWKTVKGQSFSGAVFLSWASGEPNDEDSCGSIARDGQLKDDPCSQMLPFICEKEVNKCGIQNENEHYSC